MNFSIERSNSPVRYDMRTTGEGYAWAVIIIDERSGFLAIQSDYGDYQYMWPRHGRESFKHFLVELDQGYFIGKVTGGERKFDEDKTKQAMLSELKERLDNGDLSQEKYDAALDEIEGELDFTDERYLYDSIILTETLNTIYDNPYDIPFRTMEPPQAVAFFEKIWPAFVEQLKKEIADERQEQSGEPVRADS